MAAGSTVTWSVLPCAGFGRICGLLSCQSQPWTPIKLYSLPVVPREIITSLLALKPSSTGPASQLFPASDNRESKSLEMGGIDTHITASAFVVSLVAFFIALGQLLQQYFATADGYRRCERSVMRNWARKTRLRWRWREFRFEALYTTPEILLVSSLTSHFLQTTAMRGCAGSPLLGSIHDRISLLSRESELIPGVHCVLPAIRFQENSWDFQLPDVVRPLAKTSVHDITIIARRLGMRWKEFDPVHGIMRAEGNRQISTATTIRSLVGTRHEVLATIRSLDPSGFCTTRLQAFYDKDPDYSLPMGDLVALSMPMVHLKGTTRTQIPAPGANMLGFTQKWETWKVSDSQFSVGYQDAVHVEYDRAQLWEKQRLEPWSNLLSAHAICEYTNSRLLIISDENLTREMVETSCFDAWVTMLFRGCLWGACHDFLPGERVPSEWWGSKMPIYIR
ncbi:hypothetical protein F5882DRAFT_378717 [Hyaloscypha sp. PMI_1271]|nr:hypothetical protein F5882DRAFT_378717 [Hyaloscypha sp. PMI_1271]